MILQRLKRFRAERRCTLLGAGPMSVNCVDAVIELANEHEVPIMLIASRRQIDSEEFGGGYVNNWSTARFARYVLDRDKKGKVLLARDHGGPWQNPQEQADKLGLRLAMESAKRSFMADIDAGFQILHLDPSVDIHAKPGPHETEDRLFELYEFCWNYAQSKHKDIIFEIGTEEQSGLSDDPDGLHAVLENVRHFCAGNRLPLPSFIVLQTGTKVMETRNVGILDSPFRIAGEIPAEIQLPKMIELCHTFDIMMKEHNADYLSDDTLRWHPQLQIHAANVAPEFGVIESRALLSLLREQGLTRLAESFLSLAYGSHKWDKWMTPESTASDQDKAVIAGHYIFAAEPCRELKAEARNALEAKQIDLDSVLKHAVKKGIYRYLTHFRMVQR